MLANPDCEFKTTLIDSLLVVPASSMGKLPRKLLMASATRWGWVRWPWWVDSMSASLNLGFELRNCSRTGPGH